MAVRGLDFFFKPRRIALMGVSPNPRSVGGRILSNLVNGGFRGVMYPVSSESEAVMGIPCYPSIDAVPQAPDLGLIVAPAPDVPGIVDACGSAGILSLIIVSAGFKETGAQGKVLEDAVTEAMHRYDGMRIIGPNCLGVIAPGSCLNASFAGAMPEKGHIAFISQSGALCTSVLDWAIQERIGFSYFVSIGNTMDVDFGDLIDYFGEDEETDSIILYVESIGRARPFMTAARAFARTKPILVYKAGRFRESAEVAVSHTGAMASSDDVYEAAFQRAGLARVFDIGDIFDCAELIGRKKIPLGPRLGIVTNAGGPGVMATDALIAKEGRLSELSDESMALLDECLPPAWSHGNPVDVLGDARSKRILKAARIVVRDPGVDALLVILTPQAMTNPTSVARAVGTLAEETTKPILAAWLGGKSMQEGIGVLNAGGVPTYGTPEQAVGAFMTLVAYARNLKALYETPKDVPVSFSLDREELRSRFETMTADQGPVLSEALTKSLLDGYGIPVTRTLPARTVEEAEAAARELGYPVVLKVVARGITHKTDVGGVVLGLENGDEVRASYEKMIRSVGGRLPDAEVEGVTVQRMADARDGVELIVGIKKDPVFGTVMMIGSGGTTAELLGDRRLGFPPLNERLARRMLESLKVWPLLNGYRGRPAVAIDDLIEALMRFSYLATDFPEIAELDVNPLLVTPGGTVALDARAVLNRDGMDASAKPYSHLVMRPYPQEYVRSVTVDGEPLTLRPIKPEDEFLWFDLLNRCSRESLYMRFRYAFHWHTHEVASRYCFIDYDREIAIVAEEGDGEARRLLGVGRLIADPDHETVEYAILVADEWQNRGLGSVLTDECIAIARQWGLKKITAQTTTDNPRMIAVFKKRGFHVETDATGSLVEVMREL